MYLFIWSSPLLQHFSTNELKAQLSVQYHPLILLQMLIKSYSLRHVCELASPLTLFLKEELFSAPSIALLSFRQVTLNCFGQRIGSSSITSVKSLAQQSGYLSSTFGYSPRAVMAKLLELSMITKRAPQHGCHRFAIAALEQMIPPLPNPEVPRWCTCT